MAKNQPWTDLENDQIVNAYFKLDNLIKSEGANLSKFIREFKENNQFSRSERAIEMKFQNISAVLDEINEPYIDSYKPLSNYQSILRLKVLEKISEDKS